MTLAAKFVPFSKPTIGEAEKAAVLEVLDSRWLTSGPVTNEFEQRFSERIDGRPCLALANGTAALYIALRAAGIGPGDEVITSDYTFAATANAVVACGATPVLVDVTRRHLNLDIELVADAVTTRTRAIVPIHMAGHPDLMDELTAICRDRDLLLVEDAAHGVGAKYRGKPVGTFGDWAAFSFYANKNMTTGEGGMLATSTADIDSARLLALHGIKRSLCGRVDGSNPYYEVVAPGLKFNMSSIQAAIGLAQLERLDAMQANRRRLAAFYTHRLSSVDGIETPRCESDVTHGWHLYVVRLKLEMLTCSRNEFIEDLRAHGVGTSVHFIPISKQPFYRGARVRVRHGSVASGESERVFSLPLYGDLSGEDAEFVCSQLEEALGRHHR